MSAFFILAAATAYADLPSVVPDQGLFTPNYSQVRAPVVVQGDIALLGVPGESGPPSGTMGYVEVWRRVQSENCVQQSCWVRAERLPEPPGLQPDSFFGASIAFDGKTALIGAPSELDGQEAVYVYALERRGWVLKQTLRSGATEPTNFGRFLALDGNSAAVVALGRSARGTLFFYERDADGIWRSESRFESPEFGTFPSVALDDGRALAGVSWSNENGFFAEVREFKRRDGRWVATATIESPTTELTSFGETVALRGDLAVITAPLFEPQSPSRSGTAYVFHRESSGWRQIDRLIPRNDDTWSQFGISIILYHRFVGIGSSANDGLDGALYVFEPIDGHYVDVLKFSHSGPPTAHPGNASFDGRTLMISASDLSTRDNVRWVWNVADHAQ